MICSCVGNICHLVKVHQEVTFYFYRFQSEGLEQKLEVLFEKNLSLLEHLFYQHE